MADHTYTQADLRYIYNTLINGGAKLNDIPRILKGLPASFTLNDLKSKANLQGLSSTSQNLWNQALSTMGSAEAAAGAPAAKPQAPAAGTPAAGQPKDIVSDYMAPTGPTTNALTNLFMGNTAGQQANGLPPWAQAPFQSQSSPAEQWFMQQLGGLKPTPASPLENLINQYAAGGPMGVINKMMTPASSFENNLALLGTNPYLAQIAAGQIPQAQMDQLNAQLALGQKQAMEAAGMGGALTSSDFAEGLARAQSDARTKFLSDMSQQAAGAQQQLTNTLGAGGGLYGNRTSQGLQTGANLWQNLLGAGLGAQQDRRNFDLTKMMGFANPLLSTQSGARENALTRFLGLGQGLSGAEGARGEAGVGRAFQDYASRQGLPPELQALLGLLGAGGSTTTGTSTKSGGGMGDLLGALGTLGGFALAGPLGGSLGGMLGGAAGGTVGKIGGGFSM